MRTQARVGYFLKNGIIMLNLSKNLVHTPWVKKSPHSCACALRGYSYFLPVFIPAFILRTSSNPSLDKWDLFLNNYAARHQYLKSINFTPLI